MHPLECSPGPCCFAHLAAVFVAVFTAFEPAVGEESIVPGIPVIGTMAPDGTEPNFLVAVPGKKWNGSPCWCHDNKLIAFEANDGDFAHGELFVFAVKGPFKGSLRSLGIGGAPSWSPDDERLAFHVREGNAESRLPGVWVMNSDGSRREWLSAGERPKWSPDGKSILFAAKLDGFPSVYRFDLDSKKSTRLVEKKYESIPGASWAPDGKRIAFIGYTEFASRTGELVAASADSKGQVEPAVLVRGRIGWHPNWSPNGKQIAFTMKENEISGADRIHVVDADGKSAPERLKNQERGFRSVEAEWSPDGMTMVFASDRWWPR